MTVEPDKEKPAVIVLDPTKLRKLLANFSADQWEAAADYVETSPHDTRAALADSLRYIGQAVRERAEQ